MLGDKLGEGTGRITSRRVLANPGGGPKMETSFESSGVIMGKGGEVATWVGSGVGTIKKDGAVSYRGAVYYQTASSAWSRLNSVASVYEYEVDGQGNTRSQLWEWK